MYRVRAAGNHLAEVSRYRLAHTHGQETAARSFYEDLLGGRRVWPTDPVEAAASMWFLIGEELVEVRALRGGVDETLELPVASPNEIAGRCWDAGHTVRLDENHTATIRVVDPFGRSIVLVPCPSPATLGVDDRAE